MQDKILIVDDEQEIADLVSLYLTNEGFQVFKFYNAADAWSCIQTENLDLAILDVMLPDMNGFELCQKIREKYQYPVIMLTAKGEGIDKITGLTLGADDYITKPFGTSELLARIRAARRHANQVAAERAMVSSYYEFQDFRIDFERRCVTIAGKEIHLTQNEYKIVERLARQPGRVLTYTTLLHDIWGPYKGEDNQILRVNMANIRRKLEANPAEPHYILTENGVGYRMADSE